MSVELTNFTQRYEEAVNSIKQIKQANQRLQERSSMDYKQQQRAVEAARVKVESWVADMQRQYLDPQTARRLDIVKQQLTTQLSKHKSLISELSKPRPAAKQQVTQKEDLESHLFDHQTQSRLNAQKSKQISQAHQKLLNIHAITEQTKNLTYEQGETLDIIDENMSTALTNTRESNSYLEQASKEQKKGQKKYVWLGAIVAVVLMVVLMVIFLT